MREITFYTANKGVLENLRIERDTSMAKLHRGAKNTLTLYVADAVDMQERMQRLQRVAFIVLEDLSTGRVQEISSTGSDFVQVTRCGPLHWEVTIKTPQAISFQDWISPRQNMRFPKDSAMQMQRVREHSPVPLMTSRRSNYTSLGIGPEIESYMDNRMHSSRLTNADVPFSFGDFRTPTGKHMVPALMKTMPFASVVPLIFEGKDLGISVVNGLKTDERSVEITRMHEPTDALTTMFYEGEVGDFTRDIRHFIHSQVGHHLSLFVHRALEADGQYEPINRALVQLENELYESIEHIPRQHRDEVMNVAIMTTARTLHIPREPKDSADKESFQERKERDLSRPLQVFDSGAETHHHASQTLSSFRLDRAPQRIELNMSDEILIANSGPCLLMAIRNSNEPFRLSSDVAFFLLTDAFFDPEAHPAPPHWVDIAQLELNTESLKERDMREGALLRQLRARPQKISFWTIRHALETCVSLSLLPLPSVVKDPELQYEQFRKNFFELARAFLEDRLYADQKNLRVRDLEGMMCASITDAFLPDMSEYKPRVVHSSREWMRLFSDSDSADTEKSPHSSSYQMWFRNMSNIKKPQDGAEDPQKILDYMRGQRIPVPLKHLTTFLCNGSPDLIVSSGSLENTTREKEPRRPVRQNRVATRTEAFSSDSDSDSSDSDSSDSDSSDSDE